MKGTSDIYEHMFSLKQGEKALIYYYSELNNKADELEIHPPLVLNLKTLR